MQLIDKNSKYRKVKRFQGGNIVQRDNTRMASKLTPKLKVEEPLPNNRTYLSQAPSKELQDTYNRDKKIQNAVDFFYNMGNTYLDWAKLGLSVARPEAGFVLGTADAGIAAYNNDWKGAGIQAGLELLPYVGKIGKGVSKVIPKKRFGNYSKIDITGSSTTAENTAAFTKAMDDVYDQVYLGDKVTRVDPTAQKSRVKINPDIQARIDRLGLKPREHSQTTIDNQVNNKLELLVGYGKDNANILANYSNKPITNIDEINNMLQKINSEPDVGGLLSNGNTVLLSNRFTKPNYSSELIRFNSFHESAHKLYQLLRISPDVIPFKGGYPALNPKHPIGQHLRGLLSKSKDWTRSGEELAADVWGWRGVKNIGFKDLTPEQIDMMLQDPLITRHFSEDALTNKLDAVKNALKILPAVGGVGVGINNLNKK